MKEYNLYAMLKDRKVRNAELEAARREVKAGLAIDISAKPIIKATSIAEIYQSFGFDNAFDFEEACREGEVSRGRRERIFTALNAFEAAHLTEREPPQEGFTAPLGAHREG